MNKAYLSRLITSLFILVLCSSLPVTGSKHAYAQQATDKTGNITDLTALNDPTSKEAVRELMSTLSDDAVRALLIERLDAVAEANSANARDDTGVIKLTRQIAADYFTRVQNSIVSFGDVFNTFTKARSALQRAVEQWGKYLLLLLTAVVAGVAAERTVALLLRKYKQRLISATSTKLGGILKILYTRLTYDVLGVVAFSLVSYIVISKYLNTESISHQLAYILTSTIVGGWLAYVICRFFFAPRRPDLRICKTSDQRAMRITVSFSMLATYIVFIHNTFTLLVQIGAQHYGGRDYMLILGFWMNISMYISAALVIWYNRVGLTEILFENKKRVMVGIGETSPVESSWFVDHWPQIAMILIALKYLLVEIIISSTELGVYSRGAVYITLTTIFLWPGIDANVSLFVGKGITPADDESESAGHARRNMQQRLLRVGRILVVGLVVYLLSNLWGLNLLDLANSGLGAQTAGIVVEVLLTLLIAYILWQLVAAFAEYWSAQEKSLAEEAGEVAPANRALQHYYQSCAKPLRC